MGKFYPIMQSSQTIWLTPFRVRDWKKMHLLHNLFWGNRLENICIQFCMKQLVALLSCKFSCSCKWDKFKAVNLDYASAQNVSAEIKKFMHSFSDLLICNRGGGWVLESQCSWGKRWRNSLDMDRSPAHHRSTHTHSFTHKHTSFTEILRSFTKILRFFTNIPRYFTETFVFH